MGGHNRFFYKVGLANNAVREAEQGKRREDDQIISFNDGFSEDIRKQIEENIRLGRANNPNEIYHVAEKSTKDLWFVPVLSNYFKEIDFNKILDLPYAHIMKHIVILIENSK